MRHTISLSWDGDELNDNERLQLQLALRRQAFNLTGDNAVISVDGDERRYDKESGQWVP